MQVVQLAREQAVGIVHVAQVDAVRDDLAWPGGRPTSHPRTVQFSLKAAALARAVSGSVAFRRPHASDNAAEANSFDINPTRAPLAGPSLKEKVHPLTESHVRALRGVPAEALQRCVKVAETAPLCRFGDGFLAIHSVRSCCKKPSCGRSPLWLTPMPHRARIIACNQLANRGTNDGYRRNSGR